MAETSQNQTERRRAQVRWHYRRMNLRHLRRWWNEGCVACKRRPFWSESMISVPGTGTFHDVCHAAWKWRRVAQERLDVLAVVVDVYEVDKAAVQQVMETRDGDTGVVPGASGSAAWNKGFRVFYDLDCQRKKASR